MTLRDLASVVAASDLRIDTKTRLIGYAVLWLMNARSWRGLKIARSTRAKVRSELRDLGIDIETLV